MSEVGTGDRFVSPGAPPAVDDIDDNLSTNQSMDELLAEPADEVAAQIGGTGASEPADPAALDSMDSADSGNSAGAEAAVDAAEPESESADPDEEPDASFDDPAQLVSAIEAILFVVDAPLPLAAMASALRQPVPAIEAAVSTLREAYDARDAGIEVRDSAGGVRIYTRPAHARHVERFLQDGQRSRLSQAALETLAVIAYRQSVTRSRVSAIRGVNVDGVVRTLLTRGLIVEVGNDPESGAGLFRTTELFLERMGMQSLEELPSLAPLLPDLDGLETEEL